MVACREDYCAWAAGRKIPTKVLLIQLVGKTHLAVESTISGGFSGHR
jgi:hypothetical protein